MDTVVKSAHTERHSYCRNICDHALPWLLSWLNLTWPDNKTTWTHMGMHCRSNAAVRVVPIYHPRAHPQTLYTHQAYGHFPHNLSSQSPHTSLNTLRRTHLTLSSRNSCARRLGQPPRWVAVGQLGQGTAACCPRRDRERVNNEGKKLFLECLIIAMCSRDVRCDIPAVIFSPLHVSRIALPRTAGAVGVWGRPVVGPLYFLCIDKVSCTWWTKHYIYNAISVMIKSKILIYIVPIAKFLVLR